MPDQESHDNPEGNPKSEKEQQEITELLKRHYFETRPQFGLPANIIAAVGAYLLLIYTVITFGNYAYTSGHKITSEIIFYSSALFVLAPISYVVYLKFRKKTRRKNESPEGTDRFLDSRIGRLVGWFVMSRIGRIIVVSSLVYSIADEIRTFPQHPRLSLARIVYSVALVLWFTIMIYIAPFYDTIDALWKSIDNQRDVIDEILAILKELRSESDKNPENGT